MPDGIARATLARHALRLNAGSRRDRVVPALVLMTDDDRLADPLPAVGALPQGSMIILRARTPERRKMLAEEIMPIARRRRLFVLIAGDHALAAAIRAHGVHLPEAQMAEAARLRIAHPRWFITGAAHSLRAIRYAALVPMDAILLSPVFPTGSHRNRAAWGPFRASAMARLSPLPIYALGGIDARNAASLHGFDGVAAIGALSLTNGRADE